MNYVITGGCGFIGRNLISSILNENDGIKIRVLDNLSVGSESELLRVCEFKKVDVANSDWRQSDSVDLIVGDILDRELVTKTLVGADVVVHLAANTGVAPSVVDPVADCMSNVLGTLNVLEASRFANVGRLVFASSGAPLGEQSPPLHEEMAPRPQSPYGASKLAGEGYCSAYNSCFGLETVVLRFGNVYGVGSHQKDSVVARFIKRAHQGLPLEIYGDGSQTRDFIYISDLVAAILQASKKPDIGGEVFQIATARETSVQELTEALAHLLQEYYGLYVPIRNVQKRTGDVTRNFSDTSKAKIRLGWSADISLEEGLRRTVEWFRSQQGM